MSGRRDSGRRTRPSWNWNDRSSTISITGKAGMVLRRISSYVNAIKEIIQVAYELNSEKTKDREVRGLVACAGESGLDHGLIITKDFVKV